MKNSYAVGAAIFSAMLFGSSAIAQTPSAAIQQSTTSDRASTLAWSVAAYVECNKPVQIEAGIRNEITAFEATSEEALEAMTILAAEEFVCAGLKGFATDAIALAVADPAAYDEMLGLDSRRVAAPLPLEPAQLLVETVSDAQTQRNEGELQEALPAPPQSTNFQTTSDY